MYRNLLVARFIMALLVLTGLLVAQGERGAIIGLITDPSGAAIPNVEVIARDLQTGSEAKATATASGLYRIPYLSPGKYRVSASLKGFKTSVVDPVEVSVASVVTANLTLEVGDVSQSVTVSADSTRLDTSSSE